jgi:hypothetical protein
MVRIDQNTVELTELESRISAAVEHHLDAGAGLRQVVTHMEIHNGDVDPAFWTYLLH